MSTSGLKILVIVAAVVLGIVVIANAFPTPGGQVASSSPAPVATHTPKPPKSPQVQGLSVAVFNGTATPNVAAKWGQKLQLHGYSVAQQGNAPHVSTTTVYYVTAKQKINAQGVQMTYYPNATLALLSPTLVASLHLKTGVQIVVIVGPDYAAAA